MVGLDSTIIMHPQIWKCSGHYDLFHDFMQTCRQCKKLYRADHVMADAQGVRLGTVFCRGTVGRRSAGQLVFNSEAAFEWASKKGQKVAPGLALVRNPSMTLSFLAENLQHEPARNFRGELLRYLATEQKGETGLVTPCPNCGADSRRRANST